MGEAGASSHQGMGAGDTLGRMGPEDPLQPRLVPLRSWAPRAEQRLLVSCVPLSAQPGQEGRQGSRLRG